MIPIPTGVLRGHSGWITAIATTEAEDMLISSSRDRTSIVWKFDSTTDEGIPKRSLEGHSHIVQDVALSNDGQYALTGSWDGTLRLWDINKGTTKTRFVGHSKDVLSVAFSEDNRQIVSGSRDKHINLWNTIGQLKYTIADDGHTDWVSCVRFSPNARVPLIISCGWDKIVKVWTLHTCKLFSNLVGHTDYLNTVTVSPEGSLCASGGKDGQAILWDLNETRLLSTLEIGDIINALAFHPRFYWLCTAVGGSITIHDLESKKIICTLKPPFNELGKKAIPIQCTCLCWSKNGNKLFAGYSDNSIRVWTVAKPK